MQLCDWGFPAVVEVQALRVGHLGKVIHEEFAHAPSIPSSYCLCFFLVVPSNPADAAGVGLSK